MEDDLKCKINLLQWTSYRETDYESATGNFQRAYVSDLLYNIPIECSVPGMSKPRWKYENVIQRKMTNAVFGFVASHVFLEE
jgi:hypothetical protein